jgi:ribosomal 50S subunit-recycling heat shock protein
VRLDAFLKAGRLIKRRAVAREMCEGGRVIVNGREAKPSRGIKPGDVIILKYSSRIVDLEVLGVPDGSSKRNIPPEELYRVTAETRPAKEKDQWSENLS